MAVKSQNKPNTSPKGWHGPVGDPTQEYGESADNMVKHNGAFKAACEKAGVKPTKRQASKFRRGMGAAYAARKELLHATAQ